MLKTVQDAHVLIVGASQGIGYGFVQALLSSPTVHTVYATYRTSGQAEALLALKEVGKDKEGRDRLICLPMDITQDADISAGIEHIKTHTLKLNVVVNCVGFLHDETTKPEKSLKQLNVEQLTRYFQINSIGPILLAKHLVPLMKGSDRSIFATLSAKVGSIGDNYLGGWYGYRSSKAALNMLMRTAAIEYGRKSPKTIVVMLHPGTTDTRLSQPFQRNVPPGKLFSVDKTVSQLLSVMDGLKQEDSGHFFSWDGNRLPW